MFICNDPVLKKYLSKRLLPPDAIVMALVETLEEKYHQCAMANIYNPATFFKATYNHEKKVLTHGVTRKGMKGILSFI